MSLQVKYVLDSHALQSYVPTASCIAERIGNRYKANRGGEYCNEEWSNPDSYRDGLEMYETFYQSYNAQNLFRERRRIGIGRFMQGDPMMEATVSMSGYVFSGNNPVMFTDLLGDQYKYMDKMGNRWHHADVLEGTALEGQQYIEGFGLDGFGDSWIGDVQNGGGGGGKSGSTTDYTSQWEDIVAGFNSGKGNSWSPGYGFYDGSLYPAGVNWVKLSEVVVKGQKFPSFATLLSNYPLPYSIRPDRTPINSKFPLDDATGDNFLYFNQCAIRMSITLRKSGVSLSGAKNVTNPGGQIYAHGNIVGATNLAIFLKNNVLGAPIVYNGTKADIPSLIEGQTGILYFQNFTEDGVRSNQNVHMELWNQDHYMSNFSFSQMFQATKIWFWPIK